MPSKKGHFEIDFSAQKNKKKKTSEYHKEYYWRFIKNGREIFRSSETYKNRSGANRALKIAMDCYDCAIIDFTKAPKIK